MTSTRKTAARTEDKPTAPYQPTPAEIAAVTEQNARRRARAKAPRVKFKGMLNAKAQIEPDHPDLVVWQAALEQTFGTISHDATNLLLSSVLGVIWRDPNGLDEEAVNSILGLLYGIKPGDEIEAMLAAQMVGLHNASMECYAPRHDRRADLRGPVRTSARRTSSRAPIATPLEALNRHRGKGQQKVTVEHVHVHQGGQAIVGNVTHQGGGGTPKSEDQPHASEPRSITHEPGTEMPSKIEAEREAVPSRRR